MTFDEYAKLKVGDVVWASNPRDYDHGTQGTVALIDERSNSICVKAFDEFTSPHHNKHLRIFNYRDLSISIKRN